VVRVSAGAPGGVDDAYAGPLNALAPRRHGDKGGAMAKRARVDLVLDCAEPAKLVEFWREALGYREYHTDASIAVLVPEDRTDPPLVLQGVPEPKAGKNRMHLDIVIDDIEPEIERLEALGAQRIDDGMQSVGDIKWVRMLDPEQNEFCVCTGVQW
jgi:predicted enzyme related to lactoylglutathione lyase